MRESEARSIIEKVLKLSDAEETSAVITGSYKASTRFADNAITQNITTNNYSLKVSCAYGQKVGHATTNELIDGALQGVVKRAQDIALVVPPDPEHMPLLTFDEAEKYHQLEPYFEDTKKFSPSDKARIISAQAEKCQKKNIRLSGAFSNGSSFTAFGNSKGLMGCYKSTSFEMHVTCLTPTSSGWAEQIGEDISKAGFSSVVERAFNIAEKSKNPHDFEPRKCTIIMHPAAVAELFTFLFWEGFDAKATDEERTFLRGKFGTKIGGENITIRSDPADLRCPTISFQQDGLVAPTLKWIDNGVVQNLCYSRFWSKKKGKKPTGFPTNIIVDGGDASVEEMIKTTDLGVLVTRFWYIRFVDPMVPSVTGMTRDGTFLIEDGKVTKAMKNMRFNENIVDVLNRVEVLSVPERTGEYIPVLAPALKVRDFNFTSATDF